MEEDKRNFFFILVFGIVLSLFILGYIYKHKEDKEHEETQTQVETEYIVDYDKQIEELNERINCLKDQNDVLSFEIEELYSVIERERYERTELKHIYNFTDEEKELLAKLVKCEAGAEPFECKICVCIVVLNRIVNSKFKNTLSEVIYSPGQFTPAESGKLEGAKPTADCYFAVESVLSLTYNELNENYSSNLMFFRASTEEKIWGINTEYAFSIGNTDFYTLK